MATKKQQTEPPPVPRSSTAGDVIRRFFEEHIRRGTLPGYAISTGMHVLVLVILSLIVLDSSRLDAFSVIVSDFEEPADTDEPIVMVELPAPQLEIEESISEATEVAELFDDAAGELNVDLKFDAQTSDIGDPAAGIHGGSGTAPSGMQAGPALKELKRRLKQAGAQTGAIQISLMWNNGNDLDLHVITPDKEEICFRRKSSSCGGTLDVDMNAGQNFSLQPVENVYWPAGGAPEGVFSVSVNHYANRGFPDPTPFKVLVKVGELAKMYEGVVSAGQRPRRIVKIPYPVPEDLVAQEYASQQRELEAKEKKPARQLASAQRLIAEGNLRRARSLLRDLIRRYESTDTAKRAEWLLVQVEEKLDESQEN